MTPAQIMKTLRETSDPAWMPAFGPIRARKLKDIETLEAEREKHIRDLPIDIRSAIRSGRPIIDMTAEQLIWTRGEPSDINRMQLKGGVSEQWVYCKYHCSVRGNCIPSLGVSVYFENGRVSAIQD